MTFTFNPYRAVSFNEKNVRKLVESPCGAIAALKYDGLRCGLVVTPTADIDNKPAARLVVLSRTSKAVPALRELFISDAHRILLGQLLAESQYPDGLIIDGEALVKGVDFNTGSGILRRKKAIPMSDLEFIVYGLLPYEVMKDPKAVVEVSYGVMYEQCKVLMMQLQELLPEITWKHEETFEVYDMVSLQELYNDVRNQGHEGLIIKDIMGHYKRGKKVGQFKMKPNEEIDGTVVGVNWGTEGLANEGLVIGFSVLLENGSIVEANGISQADMEEYTKMYLEDTPYSNYTDLKACVCNYSDAGIFEGRPCQVRYMEKTPSGSLRHPSFQRWRDLETIEGEKC